MNALPNAHAEPVPEIIDFVAFRRAIPTRGATPATHADAEVVAFPAPHKRPVIGKAESAAVQAASELSVACALLVESFRAMHTAVSELQESCRVLDSNAGEMRDQAGAVLIGIAQLSSSTERFQDQLDATIDAAFH
jgi:hypothetical protein